MIENPSLSCLMRLASSMWVDARNGVLECEGNPSLLHMKEEFSRLERHFDRLIAHVRWLVAVDREFKKPGGDDGQLFPSLAASSHWRSIQCDTSTIARAAEVNAAPAATNACLLSVPCSEITESLDDSE